MSLNKIIIKINNKLKLKLLIISSRQINLNIYFDKIFMIGLENLTKYLVYKIETQVKKS
jgi:hypothetical protein